MIDSKLAKAVQTLALHKSFRIAAEVSGISSSSFSRYIRAAERYAGQKLFERSGSGVMLTPAGRLFVAFLDTLQEAVGEFEASTTRLRLSGPNVINIGCGPLAARSVVAPLVADLRETRPEVRALVKVSSSKDPLDWLRTGVLDVAICDLTHTPDLNDLEVHLLQKRRTSFWARPQHPIHSKPEIFLKDVFQHPIATAYLSTYWRKQMGNLIGGDANADKTVSNMHKVESDDFSMLAEIATQTDLICGGMHHDFRLYKKYGLLKEVPTVEPLTWNICLARRKETSFPALDFVWEKVMAEYVR